MLVADLAADLAAQCFAVDLGALFLQLSLTQARLLGARAQRQGKGQPYLQRAALALSEQVEVVARRSADAVDADARVQVESETGLVGGPLDLQIEVLLL